MLLFLHMAGAITTIVFGTTAVLGKRAVYKNVFRGVIVFEFITGTFLSMSASSSFFSYCTKMGLYLAFWILIEVILLVFVRRSVSIQS